MKLPFPRPLRGQPSPRARSLGFAAIVLAVAFALGGTALSWAKDRGESDAAGRDLAAQATTRATYFDQTVSARLGALRAVALTPSVAAGDVTALQTYFAGLPHAALGFSGGLGWVSLDGYVRASSTLALDRLPIWVGDREYFIAARETGEPQVSPALIGRATSRPTVTLTVAAVDAAGVRTGIVSGGLILSEPGTFDGLIQSGTRLRVMDSAGQVVVDNGPVSSLADVSGSSLFQRVKGTGSGSFERSDGLDGTAGRMVAYVTVPSASWTIIVERDPSVALEGARRSLITELSLIWALAIGGVIAAIVIGRSLDRQALALEQSLAAKDEFLGLVSHELRTPLTQILGNAEALLRREASIPADVRRESHEEIHRQGIRLRRIVENMLVLSRLERGRSGELEPSLVQRILPAIVEQFRDQHGWTRVELQVQPGLPPVEINPTAFEQVIWNLLTNAAKYGAPGGPVELEAGAAGGWVAVAVRDHGPGVPEDEIPRIFEPYFRSRTVPPHSSGLGLGLSVCRRLVELQGGEMYVLRRPAGGMEFGVRHRALAEDEPFDVPEATPGTAAENVEPTRAAPAPGD